MPSGILMLVRGFQWVVLTLRRIGSSIKARHARSVHRVVLSWHLARARRELKKLRLCVPAGIWWCDGCCQVLWDLDSFLSHTRTHAG